MSLGLQARRSVVRVLAFARRPELLAFLPAVTLAAFWIGGEEALLVCALSVPILYALAGMLGGAALPELVLPGTDPVTGLPLRDTLLRRLEDDGEAACIVLGLDGADRLARLYGHEAYGEILRQTGARIVGALRRQDLAVRLEGARFAIAVTTGRPADIESVLQVAARVQEAVELSMAVDGGTVHVTASVGFCLAGRAPEPGAGALLEAAEIAMDDAAFQGPGAIRVHARGMRRPFDDLAELRRDLGPALDNGEVEAFFQPQVSTETGAVTGVETLVRWQHPTRGLLAPDAFLPDVLAAGLAERLGEVMLDAALRALRRWDEAGQPVPTVTVNFSPEELRNPRLADRVQWELDRFGLDPGRLVVDIREAALAELACEMTGQTLRRLAQAGCGLDLDGFGVGRATVEVLGRFPVRRLKIDRSFVAGIDHDRARQRSVAGILALAETMGLDTLGLGVETPGEHAMLAQLGCRHVQGFGVARPMPEDAMRDWLIAQAESAAAACPRAFRGAPGAASPPPRPKQG
ncbi:MAG: putative bifunctional diguanylate cyclase/phosphodiesterase [Alkalilacustris sp.]